MQINDICFYSHFGNGDIFNTRGIIKNIIRDNPKYNYYYAYAKSPLLIFDIEGLKYTTIQPFMTADRPFIVGQNNDLYINTWIGRDGKYVLQGVGCTINEYIRMFNDIFDSIKPYTTINKLNTDINLYVPKINFNNFIESRLHAIHSFVINNYSEFILICNGDVWSNQADNFDFTTIITRLADRFPQYIFLITEPISTSRSNIIPTDTITNNKWNDLIDISYLSTYCKIIIGRSSGPYVFTQTADNLFDDTKLFMSFTYHKNSTELMNGLRTNCKSIWSPETNIDKVYKEIEIAICQHLLE